MVRYGCGSLAMTFLHLLAPARHESWSYNDDQDLRRPLRPDALSGRIHGSGRPGASARPAGRRAERSGTELGEVLSPATDRTALFLENPVRGEILARRRPKTWGSSHRWPS